MYLLNSKQFREWQEKPFCKEQNSFRIMRLNCELKDTRRREQ